MDKIREKEFLYYENYTSYHVNYPEYLEFWNNGKSEKTILDDDCLYNITKYLGNKCGLLNKSMRSKWLVFSGISTNYVTIAEGKLENLHRYIADIHIDIKDENSLEKICSEILEKLPKLRNIYFICRDTWYNPPMKKIDEILVKAPHIKKHLMFIAPTNSDMYDFWQISNLRLPSMKWCRSKLVIDKILNIITLSENPEGWSVVISAPNLHFSYNEILRTQKFLSQMDKNDIFRKIRRLDKDPNEIVNLNNHDYHLSLSESVNLYQYLYRYKNKFGLHFIEINLKILLHYTFANSEYCNNVIGPLYDELGISTEFVILGKLYKNSLHVPHETYNEYYCDIKDSEIDDHQYVWFINTPQAMGYISHKDKYDIEDVIQDRLSEYLIKSAREESYEYENFETDCLKLGDLSENGYDPRAVLGILTDKTTKIKFWRFL